MAALSGRPLSGLWDGVLATFDGPARTVYCATAIAESIKSLGIEIRAGIHTGEVEAKADIRQRSSFAQSDHL